MGGQAAANSGDEQLPTGDPGTVLQVKHLDEVLDLVTGQWTVRATPHAQTSSAKKAGKYDCFTFTVVRRFTPANGIGRGGKVTSYNVTKVIDIRSSELRDIGRKVIGQIQGVSWTAKPLRVSNRKCGRAHQLTIPTAPQVTPQFLLGWLPELESYLETLEESSSSRAHLSHLIDYLKSEHSVTLESLASLLDHAEITFDLLWALYVPSKTILHIPCPLTSEPRAVRLLQAEKCQKQDLQGNTVFDMSGISVGFDTGSTADQTKFLWRLVVEYLETDISPKGGHFGYAKNGSVIDIPGFSGTKKITDLGVYPIQYYAGPGGPGGLRERLIERGRHWTKLAGGVHHLAYKGLAYMWHKGSMGWEVVKFSVSLPISVSLPAELTCTDSTDRLKSHDRSQYAPFSLAPMTHANRQNIAESFASNMPNYERMTHVTKTLAGLEIDRHAMRTTTSLTSQDKLGTLEDLREDDLMLAPPALYGFSLSDKQWRTSFR